MHHRPVRTSAMVGLLALAWLWPAAARAQVRDGAHLFSPEAVAGANRAIARMQQQHGRGLFVETVASVPAEVGHDRLALQQFTADRANASGVNGVFVLVCMDPRWAQLKVGPNTRRHGDVTDAESAALSKALRDGLSAKAYDKVLADVVDGVERAYATNIPRAATSQPSPPAGTPPPLPPAATAPAVR